MKTKFQAISTVVLAAANATDTVIKGGGAAPEAKAPEAKPLGPIVIHTRDAEDRKVLEANLDFSKLGSPVTHLHGLLPATQLSLLRAKDKGKRILTTGLPVDIASDIGLFTVARAWDRKDEKTGARSSGCQAPQDYFVAKVKEGQADAVEAFMKTPQFAAMFEVADDEESGEDAI